MFAARTILSVARTAKHFRSTTVLKQNLYSSLQAVPCAPFLKENFRTPLQVRTYAKGKDKKKEKGVWLITAKQYVFLVGQYHCSENKSSGKRGLASWNRERWGIEKTNGARSWDVKRRFHKTSLIKIYNRLKQQQIKKWLIKVWCVL